MKQITIKPIDGRNANMFEVQRDIWKKLYNAIAEGNDIGEITVNCAIGAMLQDMSEYVVAARADEDIKKLDDNPEDTYQIGMIAGINVFVDPMMQWSDTRVLAEGLEITIDIDPMQIV